MHSSDSILGIIEDVFDDLKDAFFGNNRYSDMARLAKKSGYQYVRKSNTNRLDLGVRGLSIFRKSRRKKIYNFLTKEIENPVGRIGIFDYKIASDSNKKMTSCILIKSDRYQFSHFLIRPKKSTEKISEFFVLRKIFLDYHPVFNKKFSIKARSHAAFNSIFDHEVADILIEEKNLRIEGRGPYLLIYRRKIVCPPEETLHFIQLGHEIAILLDKN